MVLRFTGGGISMGSMVFESCVGAVVGLCCWRDVTIVSTPEMSCPYASVGSVLYSALLGISVGVG